MRKHLTRFPAARSLVVCGAVTVAACFAAVAKSRAGGDEKVNMRLFPGQAQDPLPQLQPQVQDERVEVRRAAAVLDPRDQHRISIGSLWRDNGATNEIGMFADRKARKRGDVLTLVVAENSTIVNSLDQKTSKDNTVKSVLDSFILNMPTNLKIAKRTGDGITANGILGGQNDFKGSSELNQTQSLSTRAGVTVVDVLPNGNLVIEGTRVVTFAGENKYAQMRGIVRQDDVQIDNTVVSSNVADAHIQFYSEGALTDAQKKGWLNRAVDKVNPF